MLDSDIVKSRITTALPGAQVDCEGEGCSFSVKVHASQFAEMPVVKRQQAIMRLFREELQSGELHALSLSLLAT